MFSISPGIKLIPEKIVPSNLLSDIIKNKEQVYKVLRKNKIPCFSHGELCILFINYNRDGATISSAKSGNLYIAPSNTKEPS